MDPLTIGMLVAAGVKGLVGLGKSISGAVQKNKANKELKKEFPKYTRPEEYNKLLSIYQSQAGMGQLPGQEGYEAALSTRTARGARAVGKYADSPVAAVAATMGLYGREQQAIRDLGLQFADFKTRAQQQLAGAYQVGMQEAGKEFSYNQWYPAQVAKNIAAQRYNAGQQNLWGGLDQFAGAAVDIIGSGAFGQPKAAGINTTPAQTAAMQANANAAQMPSASPSNWVGQGTAQNFSMFNPMNVPAFGISPPAYPSPGSNWGQMGSWTPNNG